MAAATRADAFTPHRLGPVTLRNRIIKSATFENLSPGGLVSDRLVEFHRQVAAGGAAMSTLAYCAVSPEGRTYRHQIHLRDEALDGLRRLTDAVHEEGAVAAIQLGHAGWFANPRATGDAPLGPSRKFSPNAMRFSTAATPADLARLRRDFAHAGRLATMAGFDAIEVHLGHGYLLSQFLSPWTNRRDDAYGGSIENRARFPREALAAVRETAGRDVAVYAKLNMSDGFDGGLVLDDAIAVARMLEADGTADALELTGGFTGKTPMYLLRGDTPLDELADAERHPLRRAAMRVALRFVLDEHPFEEAFLLPEARQVRAAVDLPLVLLGGITRLDTITQALDEGFAFVAMARALLREPDLPNKFVAGDSKEATCIPCNRCIVEMERVGTHCVFEDDQPWMAEGL